jgi:hypothetical protein
MRFLSLLLKFKISLLIHFLMTHQLYKFKHFACGVPESVRVIFLYKIAYAHISQGEMCTSQVTLIYS